MFIRQERVVRRSRNRRSAFGKGRMVRPNAIFEGDFVGGKPNGKGTMYYPDKSIYKGDVKDGQRCGKGTTVETNGIVTDTDFNRDGALIRVKYLRPDEKKSGYEGGWKGFAQHGQGKEVYQSGDAEGFAVYEGAWKDGRHHGKGRLVYSSGEVYEGLFVNHVAVDRGKDKGKAKDKGKG